MAQVRHLEKTIPPRRTRCARPLASQDDVSAGRILLYMGPIMPLFVRSLMFYIIRPLYGFLFFSC